MDFIVKAYNGKIETTWPVIIMFDIIFTAVIFFFFLKDWYFYGLVLQICLHSLLWCWNEKQKHWARSSKMRFTSESQGHAGMELEITDGGIFSMT